MSDTHKPETTNLKDRTDCSPESKKDGDNTDIN